MRSRLCVPPLFSVLVRVSKSWARPRVRRVWCESAPPKGAARPRLWTLQLDDTTCWASVSIYDSLRSPTFWVARRHTASGLTTNTMGDSSRTRQHYGCTAVSWYSRPELKSRGSARRSPRTPRIFCFSISAESPPPKRRASASIKCGSSQ